jgi:tRNA 2-selenouridine synthase
MQRKIKATNISEFLASRDTFDCVIDVRSPSEFADDHIPGAINLPVLNDQERAEVGTIYKQVDPFTARKHGAMLTSRNIADHIEILSPHAKDWRPVVYCWRGGQRSGSMALVMHEIGWPVTLVEGGYKAYRRHIQEQLDMLLPQLNLIVLAGPTGCGKTDLLHQLGERGHQILDLEGLASHRGSLLGQEPSIPQPSQKLFESLLYGTLASLDLHKPIFVESESSKIGEIHLPKSLFQKLITSKVIGLTCDRSKRGRYLLKMYWHLTQSPDNTLDLISRLEFRHGKKQIAQWAGLIRDQRWNELAESLLELHYDPAYERSQKRLQESVHFELQQPGLSESMAMFDELAG